jgi:hypothetical protein
MMDCAWKIDGRKSDFLRDRAPVVAFSDCPELEALRSRLAPVVASLLSLSMVRAVPYSTSSLPRGR